MQLESEVVTQLKDAPRGQLKPENAQHSKQKRGARQIQHIDNRCIQRGKTVYAS